MTKADWGIKRNCLSCPTKFYDFNRKPILCPSCGKELVLEKPERIKAKNKNFGKSSKDSSPEKAIIENNDKDVSIILDDEIIDEHINVSSNLEVHNDEKNDIIEDEINHGDDGVQSIEDDPESIELAEDESKRDIE